MRLLFFRGWFSRDDRHHLGLRFSGPLFLIPLWHLNGWWDMRWIGHDCKRQPVTCHLPCPMWILHRVDRWSEDVAA